MKKDLASALLALAENPDNLTKTAQLRAVYPEIVQAKKAGVSNAAIVAALKAQGIDIDLKGFINTLYRLKKEARPAQTKANSVFAEFAKPNTFKRTER